MFVQGVCVFEKDLADHRLPGFPLRTTHKTLGQIQQSEQCNMFVQGVRVCVFLCERGRTPAKCGCKNGCKITCFLKIFTHLCL